MRTTLDLPEDLLTEVKSLAGTRSKTAAVVLALKDFIDRKKIEELRKLRGSIVVDQDLSALRHSHNR
jgi:Arc/MetJ family transcription regulator